MGFLPGLFLTPCHHTPLGTDVFNTPKPSVKEHLGAEVLHDAGPAAGVAEDLLGPRVEQRSGVPGAPRRRVLEGETEHGARYPRETRGGGG